MENETKTPKFTNRPELKADDPSWQVVGMNPDQPLVASGQEPKFASGATEPTMSAPGAQQGGTEMQPAQVPADPRLGMNPQGEWDYGKMSRMFPEMFVQDEDFMDPAEQAKMEAGQPYDAAKRFKSDPNWGKEQAGAGVRSGAPLPDQLRADRRQFEKIVLDQVIQATGVHPFATDPYKAVAASDKQLPDLFNHIFAGQATWRDLPRLSKEQRDRWEAAKKEHHARAFQQSKSAKDAAVAQYKWMMGNFDVEMKQKMAEFANSEKERAKMEAKGQKDPQLRNLYNDNGEQTLHFVYPDGRISDTGRRTGAQSLEDVMPQDIRAAQALINRFLPKADPMMMMMISQMEKTDPKQAEFFKKLIMPEVPPEQRKNVEIAQKMVNGWYEKELKGKFLTQGAAPANTTQVGKTGKPGEETTAKAPEQYPGLGGTPEQVIGLLAQAVENGKVVDKPLKAFLLAVPDKKLWQKLSKATKISMDQLEIIARGTEPSEAKHVKK